MARALVLRSHSKHVFNTLKDDSRRHVGHTDETEPPRGAGTFASLRHDAVLRLPMLTCLLRRLPTFVALSACACGGVARPAAQAEAQRELVAVASTEAEPLPAPAPLDPYAPTRTSPTEYTWQRAQRAECAARTPLRFEGSHAEFPLLPDEPEEAADTWGTGTPAPAAEAHAPKSADQVVAELRPRLRRCFSSWVERGNTNEGSVRFAVRIDCGGEVGAVTARSSGVDEPTVTCLFGVVAQASFESPASGQATLQIPVVFKNTER